MFVMITSGWRIYNASPLFAFEFPPAITSATGSRPTGALLWHFAAMWLFVVNGLVYVTLGLVDRPVPPQAPAGAARPRSSAILGAALTGKLSHDDLSVYNAVQRLLYLGVIGAGILVVLSGLSIWKPVQVQELTAVFGGYDARALSSISSRWRRSSAFSCVHIVLAILVPKSLRAMIRGRLKRFSRAENMAKIRKAVPGVDSRLLIKDAAKLLPEPSRRLFLRGAAGLGAVTLLTGCDIVDSASAEKALLAMSRFNDRVQALIFNPNKLAPTYPESAITRPFPFNAYYPEDDAPEVDGETYRLEVGGMVENKKSWSLEELYALPQEKQITRHICVEGWSAIGSWTGTPLRDFLKRDRRRYSPRNTSGSSAPRAMPTPSTCRPRCIRRPR